MFAKVFLSLILCMVYISAFVLLALLLSARTREPVVSLFIGLLALINVVLFVAAYISFLRYDVR